MSFKFECEYCNRRLEAEDDWSGRTVECPDCNENITVPDPTETHDGPPPLNSSPSPSLNTPPSSNSVSKPFANLSKGFSKKNPSQFKTNRILFFVFIPIMVVAIGLLGFVIYSNQQPQEEEKELTLVGRSFANSKTGEGWTFDKNGWARNWQMISTNQKGSYRYKLYGKESARIESSLFRKEIWVEMSRNGTRLTLEKDIDGKTIKEVFEEAADASQF